jgi:hypothetical protein
LIRINLLPWRANAFRKKQQLLTYISYSTLFATLLICFLYYYYLHLEYLNTKKQVTNLLTKSEKSRSVNRTAVASKNLRHVIAYNEQQLRNMSHALFIHKNISCQWFDLQKKVLKMAGTAPSIDALLAFINFCEKHYHLHLVIKKIRYSPPFETVTFQLQSDNFARELKNDSLA